MRKVERYCRCCKKRVPLTKYTMNQWGNREACDDCQKDGKTKNHKRRERLDKQKRKRSFESLRRRALKDEDD